MQDGKMTYKNDASRKEMEYTAELYKSAVEGRIPKLDLTDEEVKKLIEYAEEAQMCYALLSPLLKLDISEALKNEIKKLVLFSTVKTLTQSNAAKEIEKVFEENGVSFQMLKGIVHRNNYPRPEIREMSDIDLIIYDETLDHACEIMDKLGYEKVEAVKHHVIYRKDCMLIVEVHWALYDKEVDYNQYVYFNKNFRAKLVPEKKYTYEFSKEDFYVYMIAHMAKHFYENGCGIRNLLDIYVYWNKFDNNVDKSKISSELKNCGLFKFEAQMRLLAKLWIDGGECKEIYRDLFSYMINCGIYGKGENGVWGQLAKQGTTSRLNYYLPGFEYMKESYKWLEKAPILLPVAWVFRAIHGLNTGAMDRSKALIESDSERMLRIYRSLKLNFKK